MAHIILLLKACTCSDNDDKNEKNDSEFSGKSVGCIFEQEQMEMDVSGARLVCCCDSATALVWFVLWFGLVWFGLVWFGMVW